MAGAVRPAAPVLTGLDAGTDAGRVFAEVRKERHDEQAEQEREQALRDRRDRRQRLVLLWTAFGLSALSVLISVGAATTRSEQVAATVAPQVAERVVADARQQRLDTGRRELAEANTRLILKRLPIVPDPGPAATGDELLVQATRANVLADLPATLTDDLRTELGDVATLPSTLRRDPPPPAGDTVIDVIPADPSQPGGVAPIPGRGGSTATPPAQRPGSGSEPAAPAPVAPPARAPAPAAPAPAPAPERRGLLEPCLADRILC